MARAKTNPDFAPRLFSAKESFSGELDGVPHSFHAGQLAEAGSAPIRKWPQLFEPVYVFWTAEPVEAPAEPRVEHASAAPGETRG